MHKSLFLQQKSTSIPKASPFNKVIIILKMAADGWWKKCLPFAEQPALAEERKESQQNCEYD